MDGPSLMLVMDGPTGALADWHWSQRSSTGGAAGRRGDCCQTRKGGLGMTDRRTEGRTEGLKAKLGVTQSRL